MRSFHLDVPIARIPAGVAKWWLDFPPVYEATDPREQPYRIETIARATDRIDIWTHWRMMGMRRKYRETIRIRGPLAFDALITMGAIEVADEFRIHDDGQGGSVMRIRSEMRPKSVIGRVMAPLMMRMLHRWMTRIWADAARLCELDARKEAGRDERVPT